jgi:hypothetical protein
MAQKLMAAGKQRAIPAYYSGQITSGAPNHYETIEEARRLKSCGKASSINRGKAILIKGPRKKSESRRESVKSAWKVVGQTSKKMPDGPGYPHYSSVGK